MKDKLFVIGLIMTTGCSEAEKDYSTEILPSESVIKKNEERFNGFPFNEVPKWRTDPAEYQGPYSESGEYFQIK
ncbi:hypothetical protein ACPUVO_18280 [Pseudocolwellia sp. HL-MZ19]|uniref:hypothetical protein n=1 Tax=unclassified Pseudocolwellia TaxID=2848178 RepID=UPI003CEE0DC0